MIIQAIKSINQISSKFIQWLRRDLVTNRYPNFLIHNIDKFNVSSTKNDSFDPKLLPEVSDIVCMVIHYCTYMTAGSATRPNDV